MASYNRIIKIQKQNEEEIWEDYYISENASKKKNPYIHANINKTGGSEYNHASSEITTGTYDFKIRYCKAIEEIIYNTEIFRIVYKNRIYDIDNVDRYAESNTEITLIGTFNGAKN